MMCDVDRSEQIAEKIVENSPAVVMRILGHLINGEIAYITDNISQYGFEAAAFRCGACSWLDHICADDRAKVIEEVDKNTILGIDRYDLIYRMTAPAWGVLWIHDLVMITRGEDGRVIWMDHVITDYTAIKEGQDKLEDQARQQEVLNDILVSLHDADPSQAFKIILDRVGRYLDISRISIIEDSADHTHGETVYEWCRAGTDSLIDAGPMIYHYDDLLPEIARELERRGMWTAAGDNMTDGLRASIGDPHIKAVVVYTLYTHERRHGFIRFDAYAPNKSWSADALIFMETISKLVSTAVMRRKNAEIAETYQMAMENILNNIPTYIYVSDPTDDSIVFANRAYLRDFGGAASLRPEETLHGRITLHMFHTLEMTPPRLRGRNHYFELQLQNTLKWYGIQCSVIPWTNGKPMRLYSCQDISEKKRQEEYIQRIAYMDHLTGLPNRYRCDVDLQNSIATARRSLKTGYILLIDMDDFKIVNDGYGHDYGDALLIEFGNFLRNYKRPGDSVFRFGGDEFVLLVDPDNAADIVKRLDGLIQRTHRPWIVIDKAFYCTVSIGVVAFPDGEMDGREILKNADVAMYEAKKTGKNNYVFYKDNMRNDSIERAEMESMMRESISRNFDGMTVYYQPIVDCATGQIICAEGLIRWFAPDGQMMMPASFINLAEYLGLIIPIGYFVLRQAAAMLQRLNSTHWPDLQMSINLSIRQLQQQDVISRIETIIEETGVNPHNLVFEITEGLEVTGLQRIQVILSELHKKGIRIAMDDFGTGYSSLSNLRDMPIDIIKIDRSFIHSIDTNDYSYSFIKLMTAFAHAVGKRICVEGVETKAQLELCAMVGVDSMQGYYYHYPMTESEFVKVLTDIKARDKLLKD